MVYSEIEILSKSKDEPIEVTLAYLYQKPLQKAYKTIKKEYRHKESFNFDNGFWVEAARFLQENNFENNAFFAVYCFFIRKVIKDLCVIKTFISKRKQKILDKALSMMSREQFNYIISHYLFFNSKTPKDEKMEKRIASCFSLAGMRYFSDLNEFEINLFTDYVEILSTIKPHFIKQMGTNEKIVPAPWIAEETTLTQKINSKIKSIIAIPKTFVSEGQSKKQQAH